MPKHNGLTAEQSTWLADTIARNKARYAGWFMEDGGGDGGDGGDGSGDDDATKGGKGGTGSAAQTFTQADVDRLVGKARTDARKAAEKDLATKYADYDDLKVKADGAKTLEDRIADLEATGTQNAQRALRAEIAAEFGISTKHEKDKDGNPLPSDADLFLTGADEKTLRAQAQRLADRTPTKAAVTSDAEASGAATSVTDSKVETTPGLGTLRAAYADAAAKKS